jgi:hypothetical protein
MTIFTSKDMSRAELRRRTDSGVLQRLADGIYSDDTRRPAVEVVAREWRSILSKTMPGAVVTYASAFTGLPADGELNVSHRRRDPLVLPGLTVRSDAAGRRDDDDISIGEDLYLAAPARALVDNSHDHPGRPNRRIAKLTREQLHDQIVQLVQTTSVGRIDALVRGAVARSSPAVGSGIRAFFDAARAQLSTVDSPSRAMRAAQRGEGYDQARVALFRRFASELSAKAPVERRDVAPQYSAEVPFFESYFSNFIEGTEFTVEEAEAIIYDGADLGRPDDAHDITGTYAITSSPSMRTLARDADDFLETLQSWHATLMAAHLNRLPGLWKDRANRAGATEFVAPALVPGTLRAGWEEGELVDVPFHRAVYLMFLVTEVHPFIDGNGRTARLAMNNVLVAEGAHRIIVPTVLRLSYLSALTRATNGGGPDGLFRVLDHAQHWVSRGDWSTVRTGLAYAQATNALVDAHEAEQRRIHLDVPRWDPTGRR